ncbi:MAG: DUF4124 domain-containing protein [Gammaproteobacteria bacterium]|nr:DUF4124 domain-containing protein [Gammaproteobacteria bacterium]MBT8124534.1 DUF4124 domain-containing protein [Gammaproteobacteria bacterium]NNC68502.1 DUF4124 domain-containing protein [Gammaproteobacteria bacterium]
MLRIKQLIYLLLILVLSTANTVHAEFYRWVDDDGTIHYSDSLPPTESQREQDLLNETGRVVKTIPAPKTIGELEEEQRLAKLEEEKLKKIEKAEHRDRVLMAMYLTVEDIELVRDERIETVESAIRITKLRKNKFTKKLNELNSSEQRFKANGQNAPPWLVKSRNHYQEQLANVEDILAIKEREKLVIKKRFAGDINRYLELKDPELAAE